MGITNSNKVINMDRIDCDGSLKVTLALTAAPDIVTNPTDIALVLDRSGSMAGEPLASMKIGAKTFIDIISESTGGQASGEIGSGSRIGIVSFSNTAVQDTQLITSVATLKNAVDALSAGGSTNHADAFTKAISLFDPSSSNAKVIVMFTDGNTTVGAPPAPVAAAARAQGIVIYCIGLVGSDGVDVNALTTTNGTTLTDDMKYIETVEAMDMLRDDITATFRDEYLGKYRNSKANQMLFISAVNYYFDTLAAAASNYVLNPDHDNKAGIDVTAQRNAWIGSGKAEAADWDDATVMATPFKRMVYLAGDVQILGCMGGLEFAVTLM